MKTFTTKEATKIIGCGPQFIPGLTKKFNKRAKGIARPKSSSKKQQGKSFEWTENELLEIALIWELRRFGISREYMNQNEYTAIKERTHDGFTLHLASCHSLGTIYVDLEHVLKHLE